MVWGFREAYFPKNEAQKKLLSQHASVDVQSVVNTVVSLSLND